jgi:hypothetical protein
MVDANLPLDSSSETAPARNYYVIGSAEDPIKYRGVATVNQINGLAIGACLGISVHM